MVAAAASWMEALGLPQREIRKRFTKSDLVLMGWRSAEVSANMRNNQRTPVALPQSSGGLHEQLPYAVQSTEHDAVLRAIEERLGTTVYKMTDERGEIDLRRLTGEEALNYMQAIGMNVIPMTRG